MRELMESNSEIAARVEKLERGHDRTASVIEVLELEVTLGDPSEVAIATTPLCCSGYADRGAPTPGEWIGALQSPHPSGTGDADNHRDQPSAQHSPHCHQRTFP